MFVVFLIGTPFINFFSTKQILDPIREDGPSDHIIKKADTPTMGGALILTGLFSGTFLWGDLFNPYVWFLIFIVASFGLLGAYDDYRKIKFKNSSGVSFKFKIMFQILIAIIGILLLSYFSDHSEKFNH
jgi:phospho-N-acetylmuramoyl-pentapeptide-transferase